jgi:hypothetical protein
MSVPVPTAAPALIEMMKVNDTLSDKFKRQIITYLLKACEEARDIGRLEGIAMVTEANASIVELDPGLGGCANQQRLRLPS